MTEISDDLIKQAKNIEKNTRIKILKEICETDLHHYLKKLFSKINSDATVEITHGNKEFGKDVVILEETALGDRCTAIVAKKGDISGKTMGLVDIIKSQVHQCFKHQAELKSKSKKYPVQHVLVIISGHFGGNALKRLELEVTNSAHVTTMDVSELVEKFTEHYPQVFFQTKLIDFIHSEIKKLEKGHLFQKSAKTLVDSYVDPYIKCLDSTGEMDGQTVKLAIDEGKLPFRKLNSFISEKSEIILAGDPGTGKSLSMTKLCIDILRQSYTTLMSSDPDSTINLPLFVHSKEILKVNGTNELLSYIPDEVKSRINIILLSVDGLDEVVSGERQNVLDKTKEISGDLNCSAVVTSRKVEAIKCKPEGFKQYELLPFEFNQAMALFNKNVSDKKVLDTLKDGLRKLNHQIPMTPLSLMLLIELVEKYNEIPATITQLYDRFSDVVLGKFDKSRDIEIFFDHIIKKNFLTNLSYFKFYRNNLLTISRSDFDAYVDEYVDEYGLNREHLKEFICEIERGGIIDLGNTIQFKHRSFLDYFCAVYIYDNRDEMENLSDLLLELYYSDLWSDIALFYFGKKQKISSKMIDQIFEVRDTDENVKISKMMLGKILQAAWHSKKDVKIKGINNALSYTTIVRDQVLEISGAQEVPIPKIFADFFVMLLSETSFSSGVFSKLLDEKFKELSESPSEENVYQMWAIFSSLKRFLEREKKEILLNKYVDAINEIPSLAIEKRANFLLLGNLVADQNLNAAKHIERKLRRMIRQNSSVFKKLLPSRPSKKGVRSKK